LERHRRYFPHDGDAGAVFAAVDLGTNNCRLLIALPSGRGFRVIDAFSRIVRLGESLAATGQLAGPAMSRAVDALGVCAAKLRKRGVTHFRGVATEACRRASNGGTFLDRVARDTGIALEIIAPREEAELAVTGCIPLLDPCLPHALLFDIGGGSTEITWLHRSERDWDIVDVISLPRGVVSYAERFGGDLIRAEDYEAMITETAAMLADFERRHDIAGHVAEGEVQMLGTSGTVTTLSGIQMRLPRYDRNLVDGSWLGLDEIREHSRHLAELGYAARASQPCIGPERADLVVAGCAILEAICRLWPVSRVRVADRGLREGIILGMMSRAGAWHGREAGLHGG
jgi:exopolyphosphatase/guanosine-5'-triphosphate,3'-diphosphate pyrophosphatase